MAHPCHRAHPIWSRQLTSAHRLALQAAEAVRAAAAGPASRAEADSLAAAVLDQRPRGHGVFSTRSFDSGSAAAGLSNRHSEPLPSLTLRGLVNGPTSNGGPSRDAAAAPDACVAARQGSTGLPLGNPDGSRAAQLEGPLSDASTPCEGRAAADEGSSTGAADGGDAGAARAGSSSRPRVARDPQRLLVLGGMGARGDNGWFSHVVDHIASLRQPGGGEGAAVVCTMDYRCAPILITIQI